MRTTTSELKDYDTIWNFDLSYYKFNVVRGRIIWRESE